MKMGAAGGTEAAGAEQEEMACEDPDINRQLDKELERKSRQHNLSRSDVRNILHVSFSSARAVGGITIITAGVTVRRTVCDWDSLFKLQGGDQIRFYYAEGSRV